MPTHDEISRRFKPRCSTDYFIPSHDEFFQQVQATLVDALGVAEEDVVTRDATLQDDLGAESIDFLDIVLLFSGSSGTSGSRSPAASCSPRTSSPIPR